MSRFWKAYASVSDDIRHELIERAWFGREVTGNIDQADMPGIGDGPEVSAPALDANHGVTRVDDPDPASFYGDVAEISAEEYGNLEAGPSRFYGGPTPEGPDTQSQGPEPEL